MMENGFSSPRSYAFPAGLRVLVVDDDPTWLKILEKMLKKCSYEVTTCCLAIDALNLLRGRKGGYDIVISDVNMPDMDGFKLLEHVGLEMDLPVIMMSVDGETSRVMKGVQHGACDYLMKPIRMKELRNIWQHVLRKKIHEVRDIENHEGIEVLQLMRRGSSDETEDSLFLCGEDLSSLRKRKDVDSKHDEFGDSSSSKKPRVVWTVELHQKFVEAVNQIGFDNVGPKRILDSMKVPWLTRENVASHLQKYRLYLSRLQNENDMKVSFSGTKHSDLSLKDTTNIFSLQNSNNLLVQNVDAKNQEGDSEFVISKTTFISVGVGDGYDIQKAESSELGFENPLASLESEIQFEAFDSTNPAQYSWGKVPESQFKQEHEPLLQLKDSFSHLPLSSSENHIHVDQLEPPTSFSSGPSNKPLYDESTNNQVSHRSLIECDVKSPPVSSKSNLVNYKACETISSIPLGTENESCNLDCITDLGSAQTYQILGNASTLASLDEDLQFSWLQGDYYAKNLGLQSIDFSEENDPELFAEAPLHMFDALKFDYEYPCDLFVG